MTLDTNSAPFLVSKFRLKLVQFDFGLKLILGTPARPLKVSKRDYLLKQREDARTSLPPWTTVALLLASPRLNHRHRRCPAAPKAPMRSLCAPSRAHWRIVQELPPGRIARSTTEDGGAHGRQRRKGCAVDDG